MSGEHNFKLFADKHSTEEIAKVTGYHPSTVYAYKKGKAIPSDFLIQLADHYKTSTDKVLGRVLPAEALTAENFPTTRPSVAFTVSEAQIDHARENRELKFNMEIRNKQIEELKKEIVNLSEKVASLTTERDSVAKNRDQLYEELKASKTQPDTTATVANALEKSELGRLRAILQSIHFLSEEK